MKVIPLKKEDQRRRSERRKTTEETDVRNGKSAYVLYEEIFEGVFDWCGGEDYVLTSGPHASVKGVAACDEGNTPQCPTYSRNIISVDHLVMAATSSTPWLCQIERYVTIRYLDYR